MGYIVHSRGRFADGLWVLCPAVTTPTLGNVSYQYLVKSPSHLVQLLGCNVINKGYLFYVAGWIPDGMDPLPIDAKLILLYECHLPKHQVARRKKAGLAAVKYYRCGQFFLLFSTVGRSLFFQREAFKDLRTQPLHVAGYQLAVNKDTLKPYIRIHREAQRKLRREFMEHVREEPSWWIEKIRGVQYMAWKGVQDNIFHEVRNLNRARKLLRLPPINWERCIRRRFKRDAAFLPTPVEITELLQYETKNSRVKPGRGNGRESDSPGILGPADGR